MGVAASPSPQLLDGTWFTNASALSELVADYGLIGDLTITYGRIDELRWRLRYRIERSSMAPDDAIEPLVKELRGEVEHLIRRVGEQIRDPDVRRWRLTSDFAEWLVQSRGFLPGDPRRGTWVWSAREPDERSGRF